MKELMLLTVIVICIFGFHGMRRRPYTRHLNTDLKTAVLGLGFVLFGLISSVWFCVSCFQKYC